MNSSDSKVKSKLVLAENLNFNNDKLQKLELFVNEVLSYNKKYNLISKNSKKKVMSNEPQGRLISWSPWPPANFQTRYPAFPFVLTILIIVIGQWYLSLLR